jgi:hypothetical protein
MSVDWLYFRWWPDSQGRAWIHHDCGGIERIEPLETSVWRITEAGGVEPSVNCTECGKHVFLGPADRGTPPPSWTDPSVEAGEGDK